MLDPKEIRKDFPIFSRKINGKPLIYFDNAATTQTPWLVQEAISKFYRHHKSNVHRGVYTISEEATKAFEGSRKKVAEFINAASETEIIFTSGTTESVNLVCNSFAKSILKEGDNVVITAMEHHSNLVPWQYLCNKKSAELRIIPMNENGELILDNLDEFIDSKTRLVACIHIANSLGTINQIEKIIESAKSRGVPILVDGAQSVPHMKVDVQKLDCDFFAFSGHKLFGPTGIGILHAKKIHQENMEPYQLGGEMIKSVSFEKTVYNDPPYKFEAGTPNISGAIGLGKAIDYVNGIGMDAIQNHTEALAKYCCEHLSKLDEIKIYGRARNKAGIVSFNFKDVHPHDVGTILNESGIAIRAGHHCTQPVMEFFDIPGTVRASFSIYNTKEEIDKMIEALKGVKNIFM